MVKITAEALRARCEELHTLGNEPEYVYEQVAYEFGLELEEFFDIIGGEE